MLNCTQVTRLYSDGLERPLTIGEKLSVNMHVLMCKGCRNFGKQMTSIRQIAREYAGKPDKPDKQA